MRKGKRVFVIFLKLGVAILLCLSAQKAWAGLHFYQGYQAFKKKEFARAANAFEQALKGDASNPELIDLWIQSAWRLGVESKNRARFETVAVFSEKLNRQMPFFGRAWLYRALSQRYLKRLSGEKIKPEEWEEIQSWIRKAYQDEPGNPWMGYTAARLLLSDAQFLSPDENQQALDWMKKSLSLHYPNQVSPYLEPALSFLWNQFSDLEILKYVTPANVLSYHLLLGFMERHHLWAGREEIWRAALRWSEADYVKQCVRAEKLLRLGNFERALYEFYVASGINNNFVRAKAGILVTRLIRGDPNEDIDLKLKEILEDEEEDLSSLLDFIGGLIVHTEDPYLRGLYFFRQRDFASARLWLEIVAQELKHKFRRRYLADSYWHLGEEEKAVNLLKEALDEDDPDLRELLLLKEWDTPYRQEAVKKIEEAATYRKPKAAWWGEGFGNTARLNRKGSVGLPVNLKPGEAVLHFPLRGFPDSSGVYPYLRIRFWDYERPFLIAESYRNHQEWKTAVFPIKTTGGKRWLEVELVNGAETASAARGPILELGVLEVDSLP